MSPSQWALKVGLPVAGVALAGVALAQAVFGWKWTPVLVSEQNQFSCQMQPYQNEGQIWTVVRNDGKTTLSWMRMINEFGGGWNTAKRCETIADRLELFRKDGLIALDYRADPNTPNQYVICAKTKKSLESCPLLVTLKPKEDPYKAFSQTFSALQNNAYVDRSSDSQIQDGMKQVTSIKVDRLLAGN
jgi:Circadian oscillating protein COP23